jgi:predicted secreted protein
VELDLRSRKIVVVVHCILNQNSRVFGLAHYPAMIDEIIRIFQKHHVGVIQMACPEFTYAGVTREARTKEEYDAPEFRQHCKKIANSVASQVQEYLQNDFEILLVIGVAGSPSCATSDPKGILIEELEQQMRKINVDVPMLEISHRTIPDSIRHLEKILAV